jgi:RecA-family ATPase
MPKIINIVGDLTDILGPQPGLIEILEPRIVKYDDAISPTAWVVNGIIPEGVGVISGSGGVGKTSSIVPLALAVAGFKSPDCNLAIELPRKVVYITEDDAQVMQILHGMRAFLKWDEFTWARVKANFIVVSSQRINHIDVEQLLTETLIYGVVDPIFCMPLVVFDTASANFYLENESSNSEASLFMSVLKQFHSKHKTSIWVIAHLSKDSKGLGIDEMGRATARGAGSWGDDAMWTALLGTAEEDGKGQRVLKIHKVRATLLFDEIAFDGSVQHIFGTDRFGKEVRIDYRYTVPLRSSQDERKSDQYIQKCKSMEAQILSAVRDLEYPSKLQIKEAVKGDQNLKTSLINNLIHQGVLIELPFPDGIRLSGRNSYLSVAENESSF